MGARVVRGTRLLLIICYGSPNSAIEHSNYMHKKSTQKALIDSNSSIAEKHLVTLYN